MIITSCNSFGYSNSSFLFFLTISQLSYRTLFNSNFTSSFCIKCQSWSKPTIKKYEWHSIKKTKIYYTTILVTRILQKMSPHSNDGLSKLYHLGFVEDRFMASKAAEFSQSHFGKMYFCLAGVARWWLTVSSWYKVKC